MGRECMDMSYPIMLRLTGKKAVVVGGGKVAERKVTGLLGTGAHVIVVSPELTEKLSDLAGQGKIIWKQKSFSEDDIEGAFMIFAATNNAEVNQTVKNSAGEHQLVTVADDPDVSDFYVPAHIQRGRLSIAVSTDGSSPTLSKKIREQLETQFDERYEEYLEFLFSKRQWILREVTDARLKRILLTAMAGEDFLNSQNREADFQQLYKNINKD
jgi:precorrin-2 dehydrogenase / sirohydrochlorin ferrochelatase